MVQWWGLFALRDTYRCSTAGMAVVSLGFETLGMAWELCYLGTTTCLTGIPGTSLIIWQAERASLREVMSNFLL